MYANRTQLNGRELALRIAELEALTRFEAGQDLMKAEALAMYIARNAPTSAIANLAMKAMSAIGELRRAPSAQRSVYARALVSQLSRAVQPVEAAPARRSSTPTSSPLRGA